MMLVLLNKNCHPTPAASDNKNNTSLRVLFVSLFHVFFTLLYVYLHFKLLIKYLLNSSTKMH